MTKEKQKCNPDVLPTKRRTNPYHRLKKGKRSYGDGLEASLPCNKKGKIAKPNNNSKERISND